MKVRHLCPACHGPLFADYVAKQPDASLRRIARWAKRRLGLAAEPCAATLTRFLTDCGIKRLSREECSEVRLVRAQGAARVAGSRAKREPSDLIKPEHRAIAAMASIFTVASRVTQSGASE